MKSNKSLWAIGMAGIIMACCLVTLLTAIGQLIFRLPPSDTFTLAQLSVELILIPTVILGFIVTIIQFTASQEVATPQIYWENPTGKNLKEIELTMPLGNTFVHTPQLVLVNEGKAVTSWFLTQLDIPREIYLKNEPRITRLIGEPLKSVDLDPHWNANISAEKHSWLFMSNGKYALYPNHPQPLCSIGLYLVVSENYLENHTIPYMIYTDKGKEVKGELKIRLIKPQKVTSEA